jgi:hypothetical protein
LPFLILFFLVTSKNYYFDNALSSGGVGEIAKYNFY